MARLADTLNPERASKESVRITKDQLVLAMLAVLGGESREISERELFLACWHAFPNAMRWADTALPKSTFTASLRRLDADGVLTRVGKQARPVRQKRTQRAALEAGRSGVVKARIPTGGLIQAGLSAEDIQAVESLVVPPDAYRNVNPGVLVALCLKPKGKGGLGWRSVDAQLILGVCLAPGPEFPDTDQLRGAVRVAAEKGWVDGQLRLTDRGRNGIRQPLHLHQGRSICVAQNWGIPLGCASRRNGRLRRLPELQEPCRDQR